VPLPAVPWSQLQVDAKLGEGASGHIFQAHQRGHEHAPLALKLFKGAVTSDGLPEHELAACLAAGRHPALNTPVAELAGHPQAARGLLLPLIAPHCVNLGGPPSLDSCTRDVYPAGFRVNAPAALRLAAAIAGAVAHLHARGVMHGDLYAHNILWHPDSGEALLGDFGAATLLPDDQPALCRALLALEVRALGCLLEELVAHAMPDATHASALARLDALARACLGPVPAGRPDMATLAAELKNLA
jgi:serine/threonine protein kinase